jgi:hypothetical protein
VVGVLAVLSLPWRAAAQETWQRFEFSFANPGARSMGVGGAFVALADDPTAAFANPGGLVQLARPEAFLDARLSFELDEGDDVDNVVTDVTGLSFFSFVLPVKRCSLAAYGHRVGTVELRAVDGDTGPGFDSTGVTTLEINRFAVAGACRVTDALGVGAGLSYFRGGLNLTGSSGDSTDWGLNAGVLWRPVDRLHVGGFYREGPRLEADGGAAGTLTLPDVYGLGFAVRSANGRFTLSGEWDRVEYSSLLADLDFRAAGVGETVLDDADELHLGGEYAWSREHSVVGLRFGAWLDPDHVVTSEGGDQGGDVVHGAAGFGIAWERWQLDVAIDVASDLFTVSVSGMFVF